MASVRNTLGAAGPAGGVPGGEARDATPADDERPYGMGGLPGTWTEGLLDYFLLGLTYYYRALRRRYT